MKVAAIITAGGVGKRMGAGTPKQYLEIAGEPIVVLALKRFAAVDEIDEIVVTAPPEDVDSFPREIIERYGLPASYQVVAGGEHRQQSVMNGLAAVSADIDVVLIHDGVRPFIRPEVIRASIAAAAEHGACVVAMPLKETIKRVDGSGTIDQTVDRACLWGAQTPQAFRLPLIREAFKSATNASFIGTDDAMLVERLGKTVKIVEGDYNNIKITTKEDLAIAEAIAKEFI